MGNFLFYGHNQNKAEVNYIYIDINGEDSAELFIRANELFVIDWGDGSSDEYVNGVSATISHTYDSVGDRTIKILASDIVTINTEIDLNISRIDITSAPSLVSLATTGSSLSMIDVSNNINIDTLFISSGNLNDIELPSAPISSLNLSNNLLSTETINRILIQIDEYGLTGGRITLSQQTPSAPPTGAGITAASNLVAKGWTVTTD